MRGPPFPARPHGRPPRAASLASVVANTPPAEAAPLPPRPVGVDWSNPADVASAMVTTLWSVDTTKDASTFEAQVRASAYCTTAYASELRQSPEAPPDGTWTLWAATGRTRRCRWRRPPRERRPRRHADRGVRRGRGHRDPGGPRRVERQRTDLGRVRRRSPGPTASPGGECRRWRRRHEGRRGHRQRHPGARRTWSCRPTPRWRRCCRRWPSRTRGSGHEDVVVIVAGRGELDGGCTLAESGVKPGSVLNLFPRERSPVRPSGEVPAFCSASRAQRRGGGRADGGAGRRRRGPGTP